MLRRIQPVSARTDSGAQGSSAAAEEVAREPFVERRRSDRRGVDALRAEALQNLISQVEDKNFGGLRSDAPFSARPRINSRILLIAVAVLAGALAAFLAVQRPADPEPVAVPEPVVEIVAEPKTQILVAREPITVGQRLTTASVGWESWPESSLVPEYITISAQPEATTSLEGQVARTEFVPGEPIRTEKLAPPNIGFLSAVIDPGMRAVSVMVSAESASGGFIVPGDRVDVVLTRGSENGQTSETILRGIKVMAINGKLTTNQAEESEVHPEVFGGQAIATLELDPTQGEIIINSSTSGKLSLVLRATEDAADIVDSGAMTANQAIRLTSPFWTR